MALKRDKTPIKKTTPKPTGKRTTKPVRVIQVLPTSSTDTHLPRSPRASFLAGPDEYFYHVRSGSAKGEVLYVSQSYASKQVARTAAVREHEGRSKFGYVLEWTDGRTGKLIRETL